MKELIFNDAADTIEDRYIFSFTNYSKDYAIDMAALQMTFPKCKESSVVAISIQDVVVSAQYLVQSRSTFVPKLKFYQSNNYNASSLALRSLQNEEFAKSINSVSDLTVFTYNFDKIDSYYYSMLESFLIHIMMSQNRSNTCDLLFGEWVLLLREYWKLCTNDLKDYDENVARPEEKKLLCVLLKQIKKRIGNKKYPKDVDIEKRQLKFMCINQLLKLLNLSDRKYISKKCLEFLKHFFSMLTDDCNMAKSKHENNSEEMLWSYFFRKLNLHHSNFYFTFMAVMQKREQLLLDMFNARLLFLEGADEKEIKVKSSDKFWTRNVKFQQFLARNVEYLNSETRVDGENLLVYVNTKFFNKSQFYQMTNYHIPKIIVNDLLNCVFKDAESVSDRLVYLLEYVYQFFIDALAEYLVNVYGFTPLANIDVTYNSMIEFSQHRLFKIRTSLGYRECLHNITVCYKLRMLVLRSIKNTIACKTRRFEDLTSTPNWYRTVKPKREYCLYRIAWHFSEILRFELIFL